MSYTKKKYICVRCNFTSTNRYNFEKHLNRKTLCKNKNNFDFSYDFLLNKLNKGDYIELYESLKNKKQCPFCKKISFNSNHKRHILKCKKNPENIEDETSLVIQKEEKGAQVINIQNNNIQNNNINININAFGNESFDIKKIAKELNFVLGYGNFNGNELQFEDRIDNMITNYNVIFDHLYDNPKNQNFNIINKKDKICKIKDEENNFKHIKFDELINKIFDIITNVFDLSILEFEINNDNQSLYHYKEFKKNLIDRKNKFINKYQTAETIQEKNNIKMALFKYYKGFRDIIDNIKDKIILKAYDFDV